MAVPISSSTHSTLEGGKQFFLRIPAFLWELIQRIKRFVVNLFNPFQNPVQGPVRQVWTAKQLPIVEQEEKKKPQESPKDHLNENVITNPFPSLDPSVFLNKENEKQEGVENLHQLFNQVCQQSASSQEEERLSFASLKALLGKNKKLINELDAQNRPLFWVIWNAKLSFETRQELLKEVIDHIDLTLQPAGEKYSFLQRICFENDWSEERKEWVLIFLHKVCQFQEIEVLLKGEETKESPLHLLLNQLKERNKSVPKTFQAHRRVLKEELFLRKCLSLVKKMPQLTSPQAQNLEDYLIQFDSLINDPAIGLSKGSELIDLNRVTTLQLGVELAEQTSHLFRMDQGLKTLEKEGTTSYECLSVVFDHLLHFLETLCSETFELTYPIAEHYHFFIKNLAPLIYKDLRDLLRAKDPDYQEIEKMTTTIVDKIFEKVDQDFQKIEEKEEITEQVLLLGWPGHAVGVGLRKIDIKGIYRLVIANGGLGFSTAK